MIVLWATREPYRGMAESVGGQTFTGPRLRHEQNRGLSVLLTIQQRETPRWMKIE
jgi:hypothetical protein